MGIEWALYYRRYIRIVTKYKNPSAYSIILKFQTHLGVLKFEFVVIFRFIFLMQKNNGKV